MFEISDNSLFNDVSFCILLVISGVERDAFKSFSFFFKFSKVSLIESLIWTF